MDMPGGEWAGPCAGLGACSCVAPLPIPLADTDGEGFGLPRPTFLLGGPFLETLGLALAETLL